MLTDARNPEKRTDRATEVWIEVDARRAALAYAKGARELQASMPAIEAAALWRFGDELVPSPYGHARVFRRDSLTKRARADAALCISMAQLLETGTGTARMPASEVRAWLRMENGAALAEYLRTDNDPASRAPWPGDIPESLR